MVLLDTNAIVFDALQPNRLSRKARSVIDRAHARDELACCDISLWEIAMLISKNRLDPGLSALEFTRLILAARSLQVIPINPEIADISATLPEQVGLDPADRLIAATAVHYRTSLISTDRNLIRANLPVTVFK